jgi:hypothetical protein
MRARKAVSTTGLNFNGADRRQGPRQDFGIALTPESRESVHCKGVGMRSVPQTCVRSVETPLSRLRVLWVVADPE